MNWKFKNTKMSTGIQMENKYKNGQNYDEWNHELTKVESSKIWVCQFWHYNNLEKFIILNSLKRKIKILKKNRFFENLESKSPLKWKKFLKKWINFYFSGIISKILREKVVENWEKFPNVYEKYISEFRWNNFMKN